MITSNDTIAMEPIASVPKCFHRRMVNTICDSRGHKTAGLPVRGLG